MSARLPMPNPDQRLTRAKLITAIAIPECLTDPQTIGEVLAGDPANREAYAAWRDSLAADAELFAKHAANASAAAEAIDHALDAQKRGAQ